MSASLVGSEMCIRDRATTEQGPDPTTAPAADAGAAPASDSARLEISGAPGGAADQAASSSPAVLAPEAC
eukprot:8327365-Alexandrium_andersonii.AAC.1